MYFDKIITERGMYMENFLKKYGVIILLYFVIVGGILLLNERYRILNEQNPSALKR